MEDGLDWRIDMSNSNDYQVGEIHTHGEIDTRYINVKSVYDQKND